MAFADKLDAIKCFIADLARPFALYGTTVAGGIAIVETASKFEHPDPGAAGVFVGAILAGLGALYGAKAWETAQQGRHDADVKIAQAQQPSSDAGRPPPA